MTKGSGRRSSGEEKRIMSFLAERRHLRNAIPKDKGEREAFPSRIALFKRRGVEEGGDPSE